MTDKALQKIMDREHIKHGDRLFVVFHAAPFGVVATPQGPVQTLNKIGGNFVWHEGGVLALDDATADGYSIRQYIEASDIAMLGTVGQVTAARLA